MRDPASKIMTADAAARWRTGLGRRGATLVMTNGCFDLLHRGHAEYLAQARALGDALLVALNTDAAICALKGPARPVLPQADRSFLVASLECVDAVVLFGTAASTDARSLLKRLLPDVYVKGGDYTIDTINQDERLLLEQLGSRIEILRLVAGVSTTELVDRLLRSRD